MSSNQNQPVSPFMQPTALTRLGLVLCDTIGIGLAAGVLRDWWSNHALYIVLTTTFSVSLAVDSFLLLRSLLAARRRAPGHEKQSNPSLVVPTADVFGAVMLLVLYCIGMAEVNNDEGWSRSTSEVLVVSYSTTSALIASYIPHSNLFSPC